MSDALSATVRGTIVAAVFLTAVLFLPALADPVNVIKLSVLVLSALMVVYLSAMQTVRTRTLTVTKSPALWAAIAFGMAILVSTVVAPNTTTAVVGTYGRNSGLMAYGAALILLLAGLRVWTPSNAHLLALGLLAAGVFTASYGLLQYAGVDAIHWNNPFSPIIASLGNPDFASAYLGICAPVAAWGVSWQGWPTAWRVLSAITGIMCLAAAALSRAVQGPLGAAAGLSIFAAALLLNRGGTAARRGVIALGVVAAAGISILGLGVAKLGPAAPIFRRGSFQARQFYWDGAVSMLRQHPLTGVGLDHYGAFWRQARSDESVRALGPTAFTDAAHNVPLQMFAQGGVLLGLSYAALVLTVGVILLLGLMRLDGPARLLLAGLGGSWTAYVVSSTVSIDQVPLLTVEFATAGAVVALAQSAPAWQFRLPGASPPVTATTKRRGRTPPVARSRTLGAPDFAMLGVAAIAVLELAWLSLLPVRANAAIRSGDISLAAGQGNEALASYQRANRLLPGVGQYWEKTGSLYESVKQPQLALSAYRAGAAHDRYDPVLLQRGARLAADQKLIPEARNLWRRAAAVDPLNPGLIAAAAGFESANGDPGGALRILAHPLALFPEDPTLWGTTGIARAASGDLDGARRAFQRTLTLDPANAVAKDGLANLAGAGGK
jgi:putative inorganic carbon (HCO3(-)) transporter